MIMLSLIIEKIRSDFVESRTEGGLLLPIQAWISVLQLILQFRKEEAVAALCYFDHLRGQPGEGWSDLGGLTAENLSLNIF